MPKESTPAAVPTRPEAEVTFTLAGLREGARQTIPVAISIFSYGIVFGVLARQTGLTVLEALLMSGVVFAGSAQFAALGLWTTPLPVAAIVFTTLVINLRHILMGAALRPWLGRLTTLQKYISLYFMSDESWALTMGYFAKGGYERSGSGAFLLGSEILAFVAWVSSTVVGETLGGVLRDPSALGLDFAFTAVFIGLVVGFWKSKADLLPWGAAAVVAAMSAWWLPGKWYIILGGVAGSLVGAMRRDS